MTRLPVTVLSNPALTGHDGIPFVLDPFKGVSASHVLPE